MRDAPPSGLERSLLPLAGATLLLAIWQIAVVATEAAVFPSPAAVVRGLADLVQRGVFWRYVGDSLYRVLNGYLLGAAAGIPIGMLLGYFPTLSIAANPLLQLFRPISPLAWMPLAIIWFGVSDTAPIFLIFLAAFFPIVVSTTNSVRSTPALYRQIGENFGLSRFATFRRILLPAILPRMLTGLRLALGIAWIVLVAAEMIAVDSGLGYLIIDARNAGKRYDLVVGGMIVIGVVGLLLDILVRRLERLPSVRWGFRN
jgi:NitT/TauT family transport system permease protein